MAGKSELTMDILKSVITLAENGLSAVTSAGVIGKSDGYVGNIMTVAKHAKQNDREYLAKYFDKFNAIVKLCCEYYAIPYEFIEEMAHPKPAAPEPVKAPELIQPVQQEMTMSVNDSLYLCKILENQNTLIELLTQLMDVVLPKHFKDLSEDLDVNCDVINKELILQSGYLDNIRGNVKRK